MDTVKNRLSSALADTEDVIEKIDLPVPEDPEVVTTEEEIEGYMIVKAIVRDVASAKRVFMRDAKSYRAIRVDNNNRKLLARRHFNRSVKYIGLFDGENEEGLIVYSLDQIYDYSERLRVSAKRYGAEHVTAAAEWQQIEDTNARRSAPTSSRRLAARLLLRRLHRLRSGV
jgi:hypothetical protein